MSPCLGVDDDGGDDDLGLISPERTAPMQIHLHYLISRMFLLVHPIHPRLKKRQRAPLVPMKRFVDRTLANDGFAVMKRNMIEYMHTHMQVLSLMNELTEAIAA